MLFGHLLVLHTQIYRQCWMYSYAMDAMMPGHSSYSVFTIIWAFWYMANSHTSELVSAHRNCISLWTRHSLICAQKLLYTDHRSGHWKQFKMFYRNALMLSRATLLASSKTVIMLAGFGTRVELQEFSSQLTHSRALSRPTYCWESSVPVKM